MDAVMLDGPDVWHPFIHGRVETCPEPIAYHEAGHAVIALALGVPVEYATIIPRYDDVGHVRHASLVGRMVHDGLLIVLAGPAAQRRIFPLLREVDPDLDDAMGKFDKEQARSLLGLCYDRAYDLRGQITLDVARYLTKADQIVGRHWAWITAVARALEQRQRLTGDEIARLNPLTNRPRPHGRRRRQIHDDRKPLRPR